MKTPALPGREWIEFRGRRILWDCFIDIFDDWRSDRVLCGRSTVLYQRALLMGYGVQVLADCWAHGMDAVYEYKEGLDEFDLKQPQEQHLPEALFDLIEQIEQDVRISIDRHLDRAAERSTVIYAQRMKEQARREQVQRIADIIHADKSSIPGKITWLLMLQERMQQGDYDVSESQRNKEILATELWCSLLMHSMNSEYVTQGQMKMLVEDEIMDESAMSALLQDKYHDKRDYEWYSEDFLGCDLNEETILRIEDILEEVEPVFRKILGIEEDYEL